MIGVLEKMSEAKPGKEEWLINLTDENALVRSYATYALRKMEGPEVIPALVKALSDPDVTVRKNAVRALGYKGGKASEALPALREMFKEKDPHMKRVSMDAVKKIEASLNNV